MRTAERVAQRVTKIMRARRIGQTELGRQMGVSQAAVSRRLCGQVALDLDELEQIAGVLDVTVADLVTGD